MTDDQLESMLLTSAEPAPEKAWVMPRPPATPPPRAPVLYRAGVPTGQPPIDPLTAAVLLQQEQTELLEARMHQKRQEQAAEQWATMRAKNAPPWVLKGVSFTWKSLC